MSRSRRKNPISSITSAKSEKKDKRLANRAFRRISNVKLRVYCEECEDHMPKDKNEVSDVWSFGKDGKMRWDPRLFGDTVWFKRMMRK